MKNNIHKGLEESDFKDAYEDLIALESDYKEVESNFIS